LPQAEREIEALDMQMARSDFWDNVDGAQDVLKRRSQLQVPLDRWGKLSAQVHDAQGLFELAEEEEDHEVLQEVMVEVSKLVLEVDHFELESMLSGDMDEANAIIEIHPGAGGTESQDSGNAHADVHSLG
jgi:peptide chain release factor 2